MRAQVRGGEPPTTGNRDGRLSQWGASPWRSEIDGLAEAVDGVHHAGATFGCCLASLYGAEIRTMLDPLRAAQPLEIASALSHKGTGETRPAHERG